MARLQEHVDADIGESKSKQIEVEDDRLAESEEESRAVLESKIELPPETSPFSIDQQQYIDEHLSNWKASFAESKKIPKSMKAWFRKENLKKRFAKKLLKHDHDT